MKKVIITILSIFLTACSLMQPTEITATNINFTKEQIYQLNLDFGVERYTKDNDYSIKLFDIDDEYAYIRVQDENQRCYKFYRIDRNNKLEFIYEYKYTRDKELFHTLYAKVMNKKLIIGFIDHLQFTTQIILVNDQKEEIIYNAQSRTWVLSYHNDYIILNEKYDAYYIEGENGEEGNYLQIKDENYTNIISKINLNTKEREVLISAQYLVNEEEATVEGNYIADINQIYNGGFTYKDKENTYYYDLNTNQSYKIMANKLNTDSMYGNSKVMFSCDFIQDKLHFITNDKDYFLDIKKSGINSTVYQDIYMDDKYLYIAFVGNVFLYDIENNRLLSYEYDDIKEYGNYYFYNNKIYYVTRTTEVMTIEECDIQ